MGSFKCWAEVSALNGGPGVALEFWVNPGAVYTSIARPTLEKLGIEPTRKEQVEAADATASKRDLGEVVMLLNGQRRITPCLFADEDSEPQLGKTTLEQFGLTVDAVNETLISSPVQPLLGEGI